MKDNQSVLVTGATGTVGRAVVTALLDAGEVVRAGVRDPSSAHVPAGAEPVRLDFDDPATAEPALLGVDRLFLMRPPAISDVATALAPVVTAAARAGVRHVVVLSVMGVNPLMPHWRMERMVRRAGLHSTALRPSYFAQNLATAFGSTIREHSELRLAAGNGQVSFVDAGDVAAVAALLLTQPDMAAKEGRAGALTLTGPEAMTFGNAASILSAELGRPICYAQQHLLDRRRSLRARGEPAAFVRVQLLIDATTRLGLADTVTDDIPRLLNRPAASLASYVHDARAQWLTGPQAVEF